MRILSFALFALISILSFPPRTARATSPWLSLGTVHGCMIANSGLAECWGLNGDTTELLGDGVDGNNVVGIRQAYDVNNSPADTAAISTGATHSCLLRAEGSVLCWGSNQQGQLGRGGVVNAPPYAALLAEVSGFESNNATYAASKIATGSNHTCVIVAEGEVRCWGRGNEGQLGNGVLQTSTTSVQTSTITAVNPSTTAIGIAAGNNHTCAVLKNGSVACWGDNTSGQLGIGNTASPQTTPQWITGLSGVVAIAAGGKTTCALTQTGELWCWGGNDVGQVGYGNFGTNALSPTRVIFSGVTEVAVGGRHTCARMLDNLVKCWGANDKGQLGRFGPLTNQSSPVLASTIPSVRYLTAGNNTNCARRLTDDFTICWGDNSAGQLGYDINNYSYSNSPFVLPTGSTSQAHFDNMKGGGNHFCGVDRGMLYCEGGSKTGATVFDSFYPQKQIMSQVGLFATGGSHTCAVGKPQHPDLPPYGLYCWGANDRSQLGPTNFVGGVRQAINMTNVTALAAGTEHTCAVGTWDGVTDLYCWGSNHYGELGPNGGVQGETPKPVGMSNTTALAAGFAFTCAAGTWNGVNGVHCWGWNDYGQLGPNGGNGGGTPKSVGITNVTALVAGYTFVCAVGDWNGVTDTYCWGANSRGQLGPNGSASGGGTPKPVGLSNVTALAAGASHVCGSGIKNGIAGFYCWGNSSYGQLGSTLAQDGTLNNTGLTDVSALALGIGYSCVQGKSNGKSGIYCMGTVDLQDSSSLPIPKGTLNNIGLEVHNVSMLALGENHTCSKGEVAGLTNVYCWGNNDFGQLGVTLPMGNISYKPQSVGLSSITTLTAGGKDSQSGKFTCASATLNGVEDIYCWGSNASGQLGLNGGAGGMTPKPIGISNNEFLTAGNKHVCAVGIWNGVKDLYCWGSNASGQLGPNGGAGGGTPQPVGISNIAFLIAGGEHTCAFGILNAIEDLYCWGSNASGQLGPNGGVGGGTPRPVGFSAINQLTAGSWHTCTTGTINNGPVGLYCWGSNNANQLGFAFNNTPNPTPILLTGLNNITALTAGAWHTCAAGTLNGIEDLYCWGSNIDGQLGPKGSDGGATPRSVGLSGVTTLSANNLHTCAVGVRKGVESLYCWGSSSYGQLGNSYVEGEPTLWSVPYFFSTRDTLFISGFGVAQ